jgi:hypothetical protein
MNAIILSREDADRVANITDAPWICNVLKNGTPGYSWLTLVPDEVLEDLLNGTSTVNQGQLWCDLESEIDRRDF